MQLSCDHEESAGRNALDAAAAADPWEMVRALATDAKDGGYAAFVTQWPLEVYRQRVRQIGMTGYDRVLDAGCGYGLWSCALALENASVVAIEKSRKRLDICETMTRQLGLMNVSIETGDVTALEHPEAAFDAVFCYGVLMLVDRGKALAEFARVLKPGGLLYVCTNGPGWWLKLAHENAQLNGSVADVARRAFENRSNSNIPNSTEIDTLGEILPATEWQDIRAAGEGQLSVAIGSDSGPEKAESFYPARYENWDCVIEFTARRKGKTAVRQHGVERRILGLCEATLRSDRLDYRNALLQFPMPRPATDSVNNTNIQAVRLAVREAKRIDRTELLRKIFTLITGSSRASIQAVQACIRFAQMHFYHHFAGQPMKAKGEIVTDPIATLMLQACRCGSVERFLIDLFEVNGMRARLLGGACHTSAEVEIDGKFRLADASLYPPGVFPLNARFELTTLDDAARDPMILDRIPSYINYHADHIALFKELYPEAYAPIERWLVAPITPSVGYFGRDFYQGREVSAVQRWAKAGTPEDWEKLPDYGWSNLVSVESLKGPKLATVQRPGQAQNLRQLGSLVEWDAPLSATWVPAPEYVVWVSRRSRGWSWQALAPGCTFMVPGSAFRTGLLSFELPAEFRHGSCFVSVVAKSRETEGCFHLPSDELAILET